MKLNSNIVDVLTVVILLSIKIEKNEKDIHIEGNENDVL